MTGYTGDILDRGRALAETRLTETVTAGEWKLETDRVTGDAVRTLVSSMYTGPGMVKYPSLAVSERASAGQAVADQSVIVAIPVSSLRLPVGVEVVVDASTSDPSLVGRVFTVQGSPQSGQVTLHRYPVEETS